MSEAPVSRQDSIGGDGDGVAPGPSQLADTAAITLPKIDAIASGAVKDALKTGMSESEEVLEYLGGSVAYDLKAAAAKAATRRDLALGPKSKLDGAALNASMDELDRRAKAVAPFWVGPGVDDAPPQAAAAPALKKKAESPAKESAPLATATKAAAPTPAKPKPPPPKAELTPAKPKPPPPAPKKAPADAPKKMAMPELPKVKLPPWTSSFPRSPHLRSRSRSWTAWRRMRSAPFASPCPERQSTTTTTTGTGTGTARVGSTWRRTSATASTRTTRTTARWSRRVVVAPRAPRLSPRPRRRRRRRRGDERARGCDASGRSANWPKTPSERRRRRRKSPTRSRRRPAPTRRG